MSEDIVVPSLDEANDKLRIAIDEKVKSENAIAPKATPEQADDDDLEDGEIDDDDDNDEPIATVDSKIIGAATTGTPSAAGTKKPVGQMSPVHNVPPIVEAKNEPLKKPKSKKHHAIEDDFAGFVESAIAAALKKDGIMPPMPKILESRDETEKQNEKEVVSKSSRRRKRRKLRDEREKEKDKKKRRASSPDSGHLTSIQPGGDEEVDDDEMLCVRGGSPPPGGLMLPLPPHDSNMTSKKDNYDSDDTYSSYESYDSGHNYSRYPTSRKKDGNSGPPASRSKRKERNNRRDDDRRAEKRNRRNYDDSGGEDKYQDRHPQQPRKMELCKFYLMECCAKKDKCSYMHSDFPCKYYYLGMECVYRSSCKFSHGKPLTDQLRNILLKHLETAPKEILGTFRRISRENAINLINATHEKICQDHGVENTLALPTNTTQTIVQTQVGGTMRNGDLQMQQQHQQQQQQQQLQQLQMQQQSQQSQLEIIPSLLDIVINPPSSTSETSLIPSTTTAVAGSTSTSGSTTNQKSEKQRKSRWCDSVVSNPTTTKQSILEPPSSSAPSYLDLKNLTGILSPAHITKLSQFGIINLEQINQLTLSQLNNIGLTIAEISEIQLNAQNMAKLGIVGVNTDVPPPTIISVNTTAVVTSTSASLTSSHDVDMRFLPSCLPLTTSTTTMSTVKSDKSSEKSRVLASPDRETIGSGILGATPTVGESLSDAFSTSAAMGGIDYSQYLRDSNLGYDKNDLLDDEKDEEQLVIDDQDLDVLDDSSALDSTNKEASENDSKGSASFSGGGGDSNDARLPPAIQLSDKVQSLLNDPTNLYTVNVSALLKTNELQSSCTPKPDNFSVGFDDDGFYGTGASISRRDTDAREDHRVLIDNKDEYRDPRLTGIRPSEQLTNRITPFLYRRHSNSDDESGRSRSQSPTVSASQHQSDSFTPLYERQSMYDWTPKCIQDDLEYSKRSTKADKDMRLAGFLDSSNSDIDLRLPFQPVKNIQIAKEIDASMSTLMPIPYKIIEIDIPEPKYNDLRQSFQCEDSADPRLRRILGLPELSNSKVLAALGRSSNPTIASPSSAESSSSPTREKDKPPPSVLRGPRADPRRAAVSSTVTSTSVAAGNPQQNVEIRMLLQKSDWYKNLNSKFKIMVNQQLALVSTELKRFHQDTSPNKVFDIQFILNNQNLQQILTNLGIYIDDNGQVTHIDSDNDMISGAGNGGVDFTSGSNQMMMINNPNMMAMQQQMEFLRGPPPNLNMINIGGNGLMGPGGPGGRQQGMFNGPGGMQSFGRNSRLGILGMPPGPGAGGGFNPFAGNPGDNGGGGGGGVMDQKFNNPFGNNFGSNGGNFGAQQMNRGNRNNYNRQGGGPGGNNSGNRLNQNRRGYKSNNSRDRRGGANSGANNPGNIISGGGGILNDRIGPNVSQNLNSGMEES